MTIPILKFGFVRGTESQFTNQRSESLENFKDESI